MFERNSTSSTAATIEPSELASQFVGDVKPHADHLRNVARRYARQKFDAEDLFQETVMRAWKAYPGLRPESNMRAWLTKIMVNAWISGYRTKQRRPDENLVEDCPDHVDPRHAFPSAEQLALSGFHASETWKAVRALPETQRIVVYYAFVEGLKHKEIAEILQIPTGTVMSRLHRARQTLRAALERTVTGEQTLGRSAPLENGQAA